MIPTYSKRRTIFTLLLLLCAGLIAWNSTAAAAPAASPTNVTLASFDLSVQNGNVLIEWTTDTEINVFGFFVERGENGANFVKLTNLGNNGTILAEGGALGGHDYAEIDDTAESGKTYTYKLFEIETNGSEIELDQKTITLSPPTSTPPPAGGGGINTPTPTSRPSTSTPTRQVTNTPTATGTPSPTTTNTATPLSQGAATAVPTSDAATATNSPTPFPFATLPGAAATATGASPANTPTSGAPTLLPSATPAPPTATPTPVTPTPGVTPLPTFTTTTPTPTLPPPTPANGNDVLAQENDALAQAKPIIGAQPTEAATAVSAAPNAQPETPAENAGRGRLLLWAGFLVALFIFAVSIVGSILLFTRKQ